MQNRVFDLITAQQEKLDKFSPAFCVGEQLREIVESNPTAAEIVADDLEQPGMALADCEKKIAEFAHAHKSGNCGCCPPNEAEKIICQFYGINQPHAQRPTGGIINLEDLL